MELRVGTRHELGLSWLVPMLPGLGEAFPHVTFHAYPVDPQCGRSRLEAPDSLLVVVIMSPPCLCL